MLFATPTVLFQKKNEVLFDNPVKFRNKHPTKRTPKRTISYCMRYGNIIANQILFSIQINTSYHNTIDSGATRPILFVNIRSSIV